MSSRPLNARSRGFHRICHEIAVAITQSGHGLSTPDDYARAAQIMKTAQQMMGTQEQSSMSRYVRVVSFVAPEILAQWQLKIPRDDLITLASLPPEDQLAQYNAMAGRRNILRGRDAVQRDASQVYARQALELMAAGLSNEEIGQLIDLLTKSNLSTMRRLFKESSQ